MKLIKFRGYDINPKGIQFISKVKAIPTVTLASDWDYGFTVQMKGGEIDFAIPTEIDSKGNHLLSKDERKDIAEAEREKLLKLLD